MAYRPYTQAELDAIDAESARLHALNPAPGLRYDVVEGYANPILEGYNTPGNVGFYSKSTTPSGYDNVGDYTFGYDWNPSPYDYTSEAFKDPYLPYLNLDPSEVESFYASKTTNPNEYYDKVASYFGDAMYNTYTRNEMGHRKTFEKELENIKELNPQAYYKAKLTDLGRQMGWQIGQNTSFRNASTEQAVKDIIPDAMASGLNAEQINSLVGNSINSANIQNQTRIANDAAAGGSGFNFVKDMLPGLLFVGGSAAAMTGIGSALAAGASSGAGAGIGAGAIDSTAAALGGSAGGGAFAPAVGSGASFGIVPGATYGAAGLGSNALTTADILASTGFTPASGSGASFAIDPSAAYTTAATGAPVYDYSQPFSFEQMGPNYQELGVTGVPEGGMGPTYGELGYTGLNQSEAIAAADAAASKGINAADVLKNANQIRQGVNTANTLAKLLGGSAGAVKSATPANGLNSLANLLRPTAQTSDYIGQIKANQNPFTFTSPGQTVASPGMYDVSGSNIANALRKA